MKMCGNTVITAIGTNEGGDHCGGQHEGMVITAVTAGTLVIIANVADECGDHRSGKQGA